MKNAYLLLLGLFVHSAVQAQMPGWTYTQPISIQENSGTEVLNYQLQLTINTATPIAAGQMLADGSDLRFTSECSGGTSFNYWIESGINTASTKIWVKVDTLHANAVRTIYMQYGNAIAGATSSIQQTFVGPHSSTDSVVGGSPGGVTNSQRGFRFAPTQDILVPAFGKNEPNGTTRYVTLFDFATQGILRQTQVSGPAGQYSYTDISSPIWLTASTQYLIEIYQGSSDGYYFGAAPQSGQHLTYYDMRYCNGCTENTFPTNSLGGMHYGYVDFWYYTKNTVTPAPTYNFVSHTISFTEDVVNICVNDSIQLQASVSGGMSPYSFSWTNVSIDDNTSATPIVFPSTSMFYYVDVTDACGVVVTDSVYVTLNALPSFAVIADPAVICDGEVSQLTATYGYSAYSWSDGSTSWNTSVTPSVTTQYSVIVTDTMTSCSDIGYVEVTVNVPLTATNNVEICVGETYVVGAHSYTNAGTYVDTLAGVTSCDSIITTNLTVNPLLTRTQNINLCYGQAIVVGSNVYNTAGTYIDTLSNGGVCDSIITTVLTIETDIDATIQQVGMFLTVPTGADAYQWFDCNSGLAVPGETQSSYEVTQNGIYRCDLTVNGCSKASDCVTIDDVSISEPSVLSALNVYPNPTKGEVNIFSGIDQEISFVDATGKVLKRVQLTGKETTTVSLSGFATGVYFIRHGNLATRLMID